MKKIVISLFIIIMFLTIGCVRFVPGDYVVPDNEGFITTIANLYTPEEIGNYMLENFTYEAHDFTAQTPDELYLSKKGDCDEFSNFGVFVANYHDYETWQIEIFDDTLYQHYVAVYNEDIWYSITDNQNYYFGFYNFKDIVDYVCDIRDKIWTQYKVYNYDMNIIEEVYND